jgi:hypothetical protein
VEGVVANIPSLGETDMSFKLLGPKTGYPEDFVVFLGSSGKCLDRISYPVTAASFYVLSSLLLTNDPIIRRYIIRSIESAVN